MKREKGLSPGSMRRYSCVQAHLEKRLDIPAHLMNEGIDFVAVLFGVGCRFGEAAGLKWKHLGAGFSRVWLGESISRGHPKSTKTGRARTVVLSPTNF